ncbi:type II toxin-antitoxin system PemK/MazF family toxin [Frankia sp. AgPm24]|nr:type II toxin-antitoxin system PemK/MazF family toxin [Frankia sp. AgPm24]
MRYGEVWWADFGERRLVVLLSGESTCGFRAMRVVEPAGTDLGDLAVEVAVGAPEGLPYEGVLRVALPRPALIPCTWLVTLTREDLIERAGVLPTAKLDEIEELLRLGGPVQGRTWPAGDTGPRAPAGGQVPGALDLADNQDRGPAAEDLRGHRSAMHTSSDMRAQCGG